MYSICSTRCAQLWLRYWIQMATLKCDMDLVPTLDHAPHKARLYSLQWNIRWDWTRLEFELELLHRTSRTLIQNEETPLSLFTFVSKWLSDGWDINVSILLEQSTKVQSRQGAVSAKGQTDGEVSAAVQSRQGEVSALTKLQVSDVTDASRTKSGSQMAFRQPG